MGLTKFQKYVKSQATLKQAKMPGLVNRDRKFIIKYYPGREKKWLKGFLYGFLTKKYVNMHFKWYF